MLNTLSCIFLQLEMVSVVINFWHFAGMNHGLFRGHLLAMRNLHFGVVWQGMLACDIGVFALRRSRLMG